MPALRLPVFMLREITTGRVMKGPPSSGQHFRIGSLERSISFPLNTTSWHGAFDVLRGSNLITSSPVGSRFTNWRSDAGGATRTRRSSLSARASREVVPRAIQIRRSLPKALVRTGKLDSRTRSNSKALPPPRALDAKSVMQAISRLQDTGSLILSSWPALSNSAMNSPRFLNELLGITAPPGPRGRAEWILRRLRGKRRR